MLYLSCQKKQIRLGVSRFSQKLSHTGMYKKNREVNNNILAQYNPSIKIFATLLYLFDPSYLAMCAERSSSICQVRNICQERVLIALHVVLISVHSFCHYLNHRR